MEAEKPIRIKNLLSMRLNFDINNIQAEIASISFFSRVERDDFDVLFDNHLAKFLYFLLEYQKDTHREDFYFSYNNYVGLEQFIIEEIDTFEKKQAIFEPNWDFVEDLKNTFRTKLVDSLHANDDFYRPFLKFTINTFENYWLYETAHPKSLNNPWADIYKMILKGYMFFVTNDEKTIKKYATHFKELKNNNIVLLVASPHHGVKYKTVDDSFHVQFHIFKFLEKNGLGKTNAKSISDILKNINLTESLHVKKAINYLKKNNLIEINTENELFIPRDEDILEMEDFQKLLKKYHYYQQKAKELSITLENKYHFADKNIINFTNIL